MTAVIVSSMGAIYGPSLRELQKVLRCSNENIRKIGKKMSETVLVGSMEIWRQNAHGIERSHHAEANVVIEAEVEALERAAAESVAVAAAVAAAAGAIGAVGEEGGANSDLDADADAEIEFEMDVYEEGDRGNFIEDFEMVERQEEIGAGAGAGAGDRVRIGVGVGNRVERVIEPEEGRYEFNVGIVEGNGVGRIENPADDEMQDGDEDVEFLA